MTTPTATKQYFINQLPDDPSQIVSGSVVDGSITISYQKVGKLYFGLTYATATHFYLLDGSTHGTTTADRIAALLGATLNTKYVTGVLANSPVNTAYYSAGWSEGFPSGGDILAAILIN